MIFRPLFRPLFAPLFRQLFPTDTQYLELMGGGFLDLQSGGKIELH